MAHGSGVFLGAAACSVWAKSLDGEGRWLPLWRHMEDAAGVAVALFDHWLASSVRELLAGEFAGDVSAARAAVGFLAGLHDLGKATPGFAVLDGVLARRMDGLGLRVPASAAELPDRHRVHHSVAGHHLLIRWLVERGWSRSAARAWGVVLGGHHGVPPDVAAERAASPLGSPDVYGRGEWVRAQNELIEWMAARTGALDRLDAWSRLKLSAGFQVLATALVIVADWIASTDELFPRHARDSLSAVDTGDRVGEAWARLRLPAPWRATAPPEDVQSLFAARFDLPADARPRPVQRVACEVARAMDEPGLLIVEAPMGEGKTEAALAAAEIMAARWGAGGLLMALPTQATTNDMFTRVIRWLDAMGAGDQQVGGSVALCHGKARFNRLFEQLTSLGRLVESGCDDDVDVSHAVVAHSWLSGRKKALLANFAVATIDQLLFAALKARHVMLRHLGVAGKVVVLDEIHAYDAYMNSYLAKVLTWLGAYRVPVVALSATLPAARRRELVEAYQTGRGDAGSRPCASVEGGSGYPVLTWTGNTRAYTREAPASGRRLSVAVDWLPDDLEALVAVLSDALAEGGTALVVRNTVKRVLATADALERVFPGEVTVIHGGFITADRMEKDRELLDRFGPPHRAVARPGRHIVVASQVVEQSLDVDFDLLVTDLAPIDVVLQRIGRLHRHLRGTGRPGRLRHARVYLTGADFRHSPPRLEPDSARFIYDPYTLLRAAVVLSERFGATIELPDDIAPLVQRAYGPDDIGPLDWRAAIDDARDQLRRTIARREDAACQFQLAAPTPAGKAIVGWLWADVGEVDDDADGYGQVRDGAPSLEVLVVHADDTGAWHTPTWLGEGQGRLPIPKTDLPARELAEVMAGCTLRLPLAFSTPDVAAELWAATPPAWQRSSVLPRVPVLVVDEHGWGELNQRRVRYTRQRGFEVIDQ